MKPRMRILGPGPLGDESLLLDMHSIRLRGALASADLRESMEVILEDTLAYLDRTRDDLTLKGMEMKSDYPDSESARQHGRRIIEDARTLHNGGRVALEHLKDILEL